MARDVQREWLEGRLSASAYDFVVERPALARWFGAAMWGTDIGRLYREISRLRELPAGSSVLDLPCGGGLAFRGIDRTRELRYVAADLSPVMRERARAEAERRRVEVEIVAADVAALPFAEDEFDLCVSYNGLHCFADPAGGLAEMARVLRPGGELRGSAAILGAGPRHDALIRFYRRLGVFGEVGTHESLRGWMDAAGLTDVEIEASGALAYFRGRAGPAGA